MFKALQIFFILSKVTTSKIPIAVLQDEQAIIKKFVLKFFALTFSAVKSELPHFGHSGFDIVV